MNNSKKTIKGTQVQKKKHFSVNPKIWVIISAVLGLALIVAILFDQLYKRPLITINGEKYYLDDLTYYFYTTEMSYDYINQLYGGSYWDMTYDYSTGRTVRDQAKLEVINNILNTEVLYKEAVAKGYTLNDEEEKSINDSIKTLLGDEGLSKKIIKKNGFTEEYLRDVLTRFKLADRYKQDVIDSLDIDDEGIKAGFNYDDYREYDFEYLFISTADSNDADSQDDDSTTESTDKIKKKEAYNKISEYREKALTTEDWSTLIPDDEKEVNHRESSITASDTTSFTEEFRNTVKAMENGEISNIIETENGYYVVRMINNNSSEAYDNAVENAIKEAEENAFNKEFSENILPKYDYKLNERAIKNLRMGRVTLDY